MAVLGVGGRRDSDLVRVLLDQLRRETEVELLSCLVSALGNTGTREAVPALIEMTRHADGFVRQDTARALG
jgi:HEAT repeat protein